MNVLTRFLIGNESISEYIGPMILSVAILAIPMVGMYFVASRIVLGAGLSRPERLGRSAAVAGISSIAAFILQLASTIVIRRIGVTDLGRGELEVNVRVVLALSIVQFIIWFAWSAVATRWAFKANIDAACGVVGIVFMIIVALATLFWFADAYATGRI